MQRETAVAVAAAFGLGAVVGEPEPVSGGRAHLLWKLRTSAGSWAVKQLNRSREQWWLDAHRVAADIEAVAYRSGIAMPRPVHPVHPGASDAWPLADVPVGGTVASFLAHEWCSGDVLAGGPAGSAVSDWVGATLAALHRLPVALGVADAAPSPTHPVDEWQGWLDTARADVAADFVRAVRVFLPEVAAANQVVDRALRPGHGLSPVLTHRDVKPDNVLLTPATPILLDWDGAGPDFAEWEATRAALAFSRSPTGWDARCFTQLISAYEAAGGRRIRRAEASFAGVLHSQLGAAAWMLWRALGHRPVTPAERAADHHHALEILTDLRASLTHLDRWPDWLDDSPA